MGKGLSGKCRTRKRPERGPGRRHLFFPCCSIKKRIRPGRESTEVKTIKKIIKYLKEFSRTESNPSFLIPFAIFLAGSIFINYSFDFEDKILDSFQGRPSHFFYSFLFYAFPYCFTILLYCYTQRKTELLGNRNFWFLAIFAFAILALNESFIWYRYIVKAWLSPDLHYFANKTGSKLSAALVYLVPAFLFWFFTGRQDKTAYGFTLKNFDYRPYLIMLLIMVPLIGWASYQPGFLKTYPIYKSGAAETYLGVSGFSTYSIFELSYGLNFVFLEFFFRGFLVLAFVKYLDKGAVFAMVSVYCFLHFGKPAAETVGSIFGGAILGTISYYSRSIFGGILIHIGVAYLMDLFAGLQHLNLIK